ncbi:Signal transduction histidine kinase [Leifsonia sp. 21MFCrub1.1]|nr:Signal transduction histidine kinase [Leifsonia sp. 21MFCrub1.1]
MPEAVITVILVVAAFLPSPIPEFRPTGPVSTVLVLLPIAILPWRRRWPLVVLIVLLGVFGAAAATGTLSPGVGIAVGVAMFQVSLHGPRPRALIIGGCAVVAIMLLTLLVSVGTVLDPRVVQFGLIVAFATAAGDGARSQRAYIAAITERAERAMQTRETEARRRVSEERLRIARDLHDAVAHQIAVISLNAGAASSAIGTHPEKAEDSLATIRSAARTVLGEIGDLMAMLRTEDNGETTPSPQSGLGRLDELVDQFAASGLDVNTRIEGDLHRVSGAVDLVAYRVIQEALTNAHKHGAESRAHVLIRVETDDVVVTIANPMDTSAPAARRDGHSGLGLIGLRERVASVRGTVTAGPAAAGWKLVARIPLESEGSV